MSVSGGLFGEYQSQTTRQLAQISSSKYPDTNKDFEANLRRLNAFVDYIAQYIGTMQKGLDQANADTLTRMRDMVADFTVLFGGGELLYGIDLGDLQYFLPALGAIFGLDADTPFPLNLFNMAEKFFLGYVVPLDAFALTIQDMINGWAVALGLDPEFVEALNEVMDELVELGTTLMDILTDLFDLLDILGISTDGFGPFADIWHVITQILGAFSLEALGDIADPVLHALAPWVSQLARVLHIVSQFVEAIGGNLETGDMGVFDPVWQVVSTIFDAVSEPGIEALTMVMDAMSTWTEPFVAALEFIVDALSPYMDSLIGMLEGFTGLLGGDITSGGITGIFDNLLPFDFFDDVVGGTATPENLLSYFTSFLTSGDPLNALNLFNIGNLFGKLPIGQLSQDSVNLLDNPDFREAVSIQGAGIWTYDAVEGKDVPGCASVNAAGVVRQLRSNLIAVSEGDQMPLGISTKWSGLTYTGTNPVRLRLIRVLYNSITQTYAEMETLDLVTVATPGANQATWLDWADEYVVPANTSHICLELYVGANATAGTVKFDAGFVTKTGMLELGWMPEAFDNFEGIFSAFGGAGAGIDSIPNFVENLLSGILNIGDTTALSGSPGGFDPTSLGIQLVDQFIPGVGTILNSLFQGINRTTTTGHTHTEVLSSVTAQNEAIVGVSASLSQLAAALGDGNPDADDFERATLGTAWRAIMSNGGTITLNGHDLVMSHSDTTDFIALKVDKFAAGDFQTSEITLGTAPGFNTIFVDEAVGHNDIWLRCSDFATWATRTGVRLRWSANQHVRLSAWVNGVEVVVLFDAVIAQAVAGSRMLLEAGVSGSPRRFVIRINGGIVANGDVVESGTASQFGPTYLRRGLGGRTEKIGVTPFAVSPDPGTLKQWTATG